MSIVQYYLSPKPQLSIENRGGRSLGRCYNASYFRITSLRPLSLKDLSRLRECGFLGYGQEFISSYLTKEGSKIGVPDTLDWRTAKDVEPTGYDEVGLTDIKEETWEVVGPSNSHHKTSLPYYIYEIESRVDSSD